MNESMNLVGYQQGNSFVHALSGASKLLFFVFISIASMVTFDTRFLIGIALLSLFLFKAAGFRFRQVGFVIGLAAFFGSLNLLMIYLFSPQYGTELYGTQRILLGSGTYALTLEELFYLFNVLLKYICTIPLALLFLLSTDPSQFASSLNQLGVPYKVAYSVSLTLRYIPDLQEEFFMIRKSQEARGLDLSQKAGLSQRLKGNIQIVTPLILSSLDRIESIATAMELRRFGKLKTRTWFRYQPLKKLDWLVIITAICIVALSLALLVVNKGRFYNPFLG